MIDLADGWSWVKFSEIVECLDNERIPLNSEQRSKIKGDIPYYGANGKLDSIDQFIFDEELLLVAEDGGSWGNKQKCSYIIRGKSWVNNHAHVLRMKELANIVYIMHFLNYSDLNKYITGTTRGKLNKKNMNKINVILPPLPTQKKIVAILEKAEKLKGWRREADELTDEFLKSTFLEMFGDPVNNPKGWEMRNLGEVAEVSSGLTLNSQRRANKENLFPYLRVANVYRNKLDLNEIKYIHVSDLEFERFLLKKNDVLIVEGHGNIEEIGRAAIWNGGIPNCLHQNHIIKVRLNDNYISPYFLSFFLNFYGNYGYFSSKSRTTSGLNTISTNKVRKAKIPLPPVSLQKKFAEIYKTIEQLREHQIQSRQHIEDLFNALMQQAFRGELT